MDGWVGRGDGVQISHEILLGRWMSRRTFLVPRGRKDEAPWTLEMCSDDCWRSMRGWRGAAGAYGMVCWRRDLRVFRFHLVLELAVAVGGSVEACALVADVLTTSI